MVNFFVAGCVLAAEGERWLSGVRTSNRRSRTQYSAQRSSMTDGSYAFGSSWLIGVLRVALDEAFPFAAFQTVHSFREVFMRRLLPVFLLVSIVTLPAFARSGQSRASVGNNITVAEGETAGDIACAFCSVHVHGDVRGDVAVLFGTISVDSDHSIAGDVAALGGDLHLGEEARVGGDVAILAGDAQLGPGAAIRGDRTILPGRFWLLLLFLPLLIPIGIIWLIVYLVQRNRYRFPAYPQGRRF
jgi:hypothetical protein